MKKTLSTSITIHADTATVWQILTDFDQYGAWNPFIKSILGDVRVGNQITVFIQSEGMKGMTFKPKVLAFDVQKEFRWLGHLWIPGLFDGEHCFKLIAHEDGSTTFIHSENFSGVLVGMLTKTLDNQTRKGFEAMNQQLKVLAEASN